MGVASWHDEGELVYLTMSSVIPEFEYDIFISYRHNDNRSGWVTEFVKSLQEELASTIKESVSVYFDSNPHDGLLETHNVDKSLEGKLKCLIFIPIISQTYCDPKSFAWQHEFCAFNKLVSVGRAPLSSGASGEGPASPPKLSQRRRGVRPDQFGRDVKLINGNVASRILPVKIHELDAEDKALLENEIGGVLRAIEFIYKEAGVNRSLKPRDSKNDNQNRTDYRNQVNKVANAVKEIITSLRQPVSKISASARSTYSTPTGNTSKLSKKNIAFASIGSMILLAFIYGVSQFMGPAREGTEAIEKSIAVLPFVDMSADKDQEYFSDGLSEELLNLLSKIPELKVIGRTSSFSFKGKNEDLRSIGKKLGVANILEGSVQKEGNNIRVTAQLIRAADGSHLWSERYDRDLEGIFKLQDEIAGAVVRQLQLELLIVPKGATAQTNIEVHNLILQGNYFYDKLDKENVAKALDFYFQALAIDSLDARVWVVIARSYSRQGWQNYIEQNEGYEKARKAAAKAIALDNTLAEGYSVLAGVKYYHDFDWDGAQATYKKALSLEPGNPEILRNLGDIALTLGRWEESKQFIKQSRTIDPLKVITYFSEGGHLTYTDHLEDAIVSYKKVLELNPQFQRAHMYLGRTYLLQDKPEMALAEMQQETMEVFKRFGLALAYHALGRKKEANEELTNYIAIYQNDWAYLIAEIYAFRGEKDKAFEWLEKAYLRKDTWLIWLKGDPLLKNLEGDPRHTALLKKMKLPV